jgi:ParB family chromosome partitioning protein
MTSSNSKPAAKPAALGRGLAALMGDVADYAPRPVQNLAQQPAPPRLSGQMPETVAPVSPATLAPTTPVAERSGSRSLPLTALQPGSFQPRRIFDPEALKGLAASIRERGILEPLLVRPIPDAPDLYEIIAGERRWRAAQMAGLHEVPVLIRAMSDREALECGLIENIQRQDLNAIEEGEAYRRLLDEFSYSQEDLSRIVGKSRPHITNCIRLLNLPEGVKQMVVEGKLSATHARALTVTRDPLFVAQEAVRRGLNVRQTEALARLHNDNPEIHVRRKDLDEGNADTRRLEKDLEQSLGLRVQIRNMGREGAMQGGLTIFYKDLDQLDEVIKRLRQGHQ